MRLASVAPDKARSEIQKIKEIFAVPDNQSVVSVIALGYSDMEIERPQRKTFEDITVMK